MSPFTTDDPRSPRPPGAETKLYPPLNATTKHESSALRLWYSGHSMDEFQNENLRALLEHPERHEQALELVAALGADDVLSAAMANIDLEHWPALLSAAQARSEGTLLAGLAHSAGLHETAPHLIEGLTSTADAARCRPARNS